MIQIQLAKAFLFKLKEMFYKRETFLLNFKSFLLGCGVNGELVSTQVWLIIDI